MQLLNKIIKYAATFGLLALTIQACDDLGSDVIPPDDELEQAADVEMPLTGSSPVIVNLLQSTSLVGNATISITKEPKRGTITFLKSALLKYTPDADFTSGADSAVYSVCVGSQCDEGTIEFRFEEPADECTVMAVYDRIEAAPAGQQVAIYILDNDSLCDEQFDVSTLTIAEAPEHGEAQATDGLIFYYPDASHEGTVQMVYSIATHSDPQKLYYGVVDVVLQPPVFGAVDDTFNYTYSEYQSLLDESQGTGIFYLLSDIVGNDDLAGHTIAELEISIVTNATYGSVTVNSDGFSYTVGSEFSGSDSFTYRICYGDVCDDATVTIAVSDYPDGVIEARNDTFVFGTQAEFEAALNGGTLLWGIDDILGNDDLDGYAYNQLSSISIYSQPELGQAEYYSLEGFGYTPNEIFNGSDSFRYEVCYDGQCSVGIVTITVDEW